VLYLVGRPDEFHLVPLAVVLAIGLAQTTGSGLAVPHAMRHRTRRIRLSHAESGPRDVVLQDLTPLGVVVLALIAVHGLERRAGRGGPRAAPAAPAGARPLGRPARVGDRAQRVVAVLGRLRPRRLPARDVRASSALRALRPV